MAGLQYKENLTIISGGYSGEGVGSNGVTTSWTDVPAMSGSSTVTYYYHDSVQATDTNSTLVEVTITDTWSAELVEGNTYRVTVHTTLGPIKRTKVGSPDAFSVSIFAKRTKSGANIWTSGGCIDAAITHTDLSGTIDMGSYTIELPPEDSGSMRGTVYYRSNVCGHDSDTPPSMYVDEFWLGINFRNTLPAEIIPGALWNGSSWKSHNRKAKGAMVKCTNGWVVTKTTDGGSGDDDPPQIVHRVNNGGTYSLKYINQRLIGDQTP